MRSAVSVHDQLVPELVRWLKSGEPYSRAALEAFRRMGSAAARPEMLSALMDRLQFSEFQLALYGHEPAFWETHARAALVLQNMGAAAAQTEIMRLLVELLRVPAVGSQLAGNVLHALLSMGGPLPPETTDRLMEMLWDPNEYVRYNSAHALAMMSVAESRPDVVDRLMELLMDPDFTLRSCATRALAESEPEAVRSRVALRLMELPQNARYDAAYALGENVNFGGRFFVDKGGLRIAWVRDLARL